jgi:hypothetical protein
VAEATPTQSARGALRALAPTIAGALFVLVAFSLPRAGVAILPLFLIPMGIGIGVRFYRAPHHSYSRRLEAARGLIWIVTVSIVASFHTYYILASRADAQRVADKVLTYRSEHGAYPPSMQVLNEDTEKLDRKWMLGYALRSDGTPYLIYGITFLPFEAYGFDFEKRVWVHLLD